MVDVGAKGVTSREATASCLVRMASETIELIRTGGGPKGDPLEIARISGILGAKKTSELIPLCHQIPLSGIEMEVTVKDEGIAIAAKVRTEAKTGVEMEAMTAVSVAALTVYDMCKAVQRDIEITGIRLESKTGGKSDYTRPE